MVPVYEKLLELSVNEQIIEYIETNILLSKYQAEFRKINLCDTTLQTTLSSWKNALNEKQVNVIVFIDFHRAFETIDNNYEFGHNIVKWITSYLKNRTQTTKYKNDISLPRDNIRCTPRNRHGT